MHYPTDVIGGWIVGFIWASICWLVAQRFEGATHIQAEKDEISVNDGRSRGRCCCVALLAAGAAAFFCSRRRAASPLDASRLTWVADAHQLGPVGYRDPAGAISPDGRWIAYSEGRFLRVRAADGGPLVDLPAGEAQIRTIAWSPDNRTILADGFRRRPTGRCTTASTARAVRSGPIAIRCKGGRISDLRQPAWSPDGRSIAAIVNGRDGQELWTIAADGSSASAQRMCQSHRVSRRGRLAARSPAWRRPMAARA